MTTPPAPDALAALCAAHNRFCADATRENADALSAAFVTANEVLARRKGGETSDDVHFIHCFADDEMARGNVSNAQRFIEIAAALTRDQGEVVAWRGGEMSLTEDRVREIVREEISKWVAETMEKEEEADAMEEAIHEAAMNDSFGWHGQG